ncbi:hypothetical protein IH992_23070 [Candidatus Poribacteria bacterium]|nr:hypothetical protein [Candidatus Poribacteria bacterium]
MNIYVVVEGEIGERYVYEKWIPLANPEMTRVDTIFDIASNHFAIVAGGGYPSYFDTIEAEIENVNSVRNIDRFVIAIDSEEMTFEEKYEEVSEFIRDKPCAASIFIVIQHFCLETWALGNKRVGPRNPRHPTLRKYKKIFNVLERDPELLPPYDRLNRAQFAERYLRTMLNDKNRNLTYTKRNPKALLHKTYFTEVKKRLETTGHIASFVAFLEAFR